MRNVERSASKVEQRLAAAVSEFDLSPEMGGPVQMERVIVARPSLLLQGEQ